MVIVKFSLTNFIDNGLDYSSDIKKIKNKNFFEICDLFIYKTLLCLSIWSPSKKTCDIYLCKERFQTGQIGGPFHSWHNRPLCRKVNRRDQPSNLLYLWTRGILVKLN